MSEQKTEFLITARDETREAFRSVEAGLGRVSAAMGGMLAPLAALASVAGFGALIKSQIDLADQLNKTSQKLGIAVEDLSAYQYAAKLSDISNEQLTGGMAKLAKTMQDAASNKTGEAATAFRALGVSVTDAAGNLRPLNLVLDEVSRRFEETRDGTNKTAMAMQLFGRSGTELVPLLNSLRGLSAEARRFGAIISSDTAHQAEAFKDNVDRLKAAAGGMANTMAAQMLPALIGITDAMVGTAKSSSFLEATAKTLGFTLQSLTTVGIGVANAFEQTGAWIGAGAASAVAASQGEFSRAREIVRSAAEDIEAMNAQAEASIRKVWSGESDTKIGAAMYAASNGPGRAMPEMPSITRQGETEGIGDKEAKQTEKYQSELAKQVAALALSTAPLSEQLLLKMESQQVIIDSAWQAGLINDQMFQELDLQNRQMYEDRKVELEQQSLIKRQQAQDAARAREYGAQFAWQGQVNALMQGSFNQQLQGTGIMLGQMSTLMQSSKKKEFELGKKAAIGQALVNTYLGVSSALSYGFPIGLIFAAISLAAGLANVNRIRSQKFGGGGGATGTFSASPGGGHAPRAGGAESSANRAGQHTAACREY